jgi:uncharacterized protein (DUF2141 family)
MKSILSFLLSVSGLIAMAQHSVTVNVSGLLNPDGEVVGYLYKEGQKLKLKGEHYRRVSVRAREGSVSLTFVNIPKGDYAILILHDEDKDGKLDMYFFGPPKEGVCASNNPKGHPKFEEARFTLSGDVVLDLEMNYLFR